MLLGEIYMAEKEEIGKVTHFFNKISVAVIQVTGNLKVGDKISIEGPGDVVEQTVDSMQIDKTKIEEANPGDDIGMKTAGPVKAGYKVFKIIEE
jgi:translation elongation factor EF-1alpha